MAPRRWERRIIIGPGPDDDAMKNSPQHNEHRRQRRANLETWPFIALAHCRYRAKKKGLACTVTVTDIKVPEVCPILGLKLVAGGTMRPDSPSIDRVDNTKGYVPGNVRVISRAANTMKGEATVLNIVCMLEYMTGRR